MRIKGIVVIVAFLVCALIGCASDGHHSDDVLTSEEPCICGTREGDVHGCHCTLCAEHGGNPNNPHCICGPLSPGEER